jgi:hypothetical protein
MSHLWLLLVLFRVSEPSFLEDKVAVGDAIYLEKVIMYIFK